MNLKSIFFLLSMVFSGITNAGFSDSKVTQSFKCGREDATAALIDAIRDAAVMRISPESSDFTKFQNKISAISIVPSEITTTIQNKNTASCVASVSVIMPTELKELSVKAPKVFSDFVMENQALYKMDTLRWNNVSYDLRLADNEKDISVLIGSTSIPMQIGLAKAAYLAISADSIIQSNDPAKINDYKNKYEVEDAKLNKIWKAIPASFRASMKDEQVSWVWSKQKQCGDIFLASDISLSVSQRVAIYECQTAMTTERIKYLGGYR